MSYSAIIQKDSPAIVWGLDESSGTTIYPDRFLYASTSGNFYTGTYSSGIQRVNFPIVYGGGQCIRITGNKTIKVPSLDKMSIKDMRNASSIEFWIKINTSASTEQIFMEKTGGAYNTKIFIKNDFITFRFGTTTRYFEVSSPVESINKPMHIVASYSPNYISISVNGVMNKKDIFDIYELFNTYDANNEYFVFKKPSSISNFQIDSIALYSYVLPRERALKHFIYGCGYNIPDGFINSNAGVSYNFSMNNHSAIKKYVMGDGEQWSLSNRDNIQLVNNTLTINRRTVPDIGLKHNISSSEITNLFVTDDKFIFNEYSYLNIKSAAEIVPHGYGGWLFEFDIASAPSSEETLFFVSSEESNGYIHCYIDATKIYFDINGTITDKTLPETSGTFIAGYYLDDDYSYIIYGSNKENGHLELKDSSFGKYHVRVGSSPQWWQGTDDTNTPTQYPTSCSLTQIRALGLGQITYTSLSTLTNHYTVTPNYGQRRFVIASSGSVDITIPQRALCLNNTNHTGACRIEVGHPLGSESCLISVKGELYKDSTLSSTFKSSEQLDERIITSGDWLSNRSVEITTLEDNYLDLLTFTVNLSTADLENNPATLSFFKLASFEIKEDGNDRYLLSNSSPGGTPAKIYGKGSYGFRVPDLIETPALYNGFTSGLSLQNSYTKVENTFSSFDEKGINLISFMLFVASSANSELNIISSGTSYLLSVSMNSSSVATTTHTGFDLYVNGSVANNILLDQWQHVCLVPTSEIADGNDLILGSFFNDSAVQLDQLSLFFKEVASPDDFITNLYSLFVGGGEIDRVDTSTLTMLDTQSFANGTVYTSNIKHEKRMNIILNESNLNSNISSLIDSDGFTLPINYIAQTSKLDYIVRASLSSGSLTSIVIDGDATNIFANNTILLKKITSGTTSTVNKTVTAVSYDSTLKKTTITISSAESVSNGTQLYFSNYPKVQNDTTYAKTFIGTNQLKQGDRILVYLPQSDKYYDYLVSQTLNIDKSDVMPQPATTGHIIFTATAMDTETMYVVDSRKEKLKYIYNGTSLIQTLPYKKIKSKKEPTETIL